MRADPSQDMHVHSTFSDGKGTIAENVEAARQQNLRTICLVDHVRVDTDWLPEFIAATDLLRRAEEGREHPIAIRRGVETKILNRAGDLDLPADLSGLDHILVADHQFPMAEGPLHPKEVLALREQGAWADADLLEVLVEATGNSLGPVAGSGILAHLFSVLPKAGLREDDVTPAALDWLAARCAEHEVMVEVNERWNCPSARSLSYFVRRGVGLVCSTDSHRVETIGNYDKVRATLRELDALEEPSA
jgi:putative hydrolase